MATPSNPKKSGRNADGLPDNGKKQERKRSGVKKVFSPSEQVGNAEKIVSTTTEVQLDHITLDLPPGPVIQVHSPRMRIAVDTFLKNTSAVHTAFRAMLQGPDGGFQGDMHAIILAHIENDLCTAALASAKKNRWFIHYSNPDSLSQLIETCPKNLLPTRMGGEARIIEEVLKHPRINSQKPENIKDCAHLALASFDSPHGPGGHHRLANSADIPRLEEYAVEFEKETGYPAPSDWETLIMENRILCGMVEGTVASVAVRKAQTLDNLLVEGVYTFKPYRRRGLARKLVAGLARQAAGKELATVTIVGKSNRPMLNLLEYLRFIVGADYYIATFKGRKSKKKSG